MLIFSQFFKMEASQLKMKISITHTVGPRQAHVSAAEVIVAFLKQYYDSTVSVNTTFPCIFGMGHTHDMRACKERAHTEWHMRCLSCYMAMQLHIPIPSHGEEGLFGLIKQAEA